MGKNLGFYRYAAVIMGIVFCGSCASTGEQPGSGKTVGETAISGPQESRLRRIVREDLREAASRGDERSAKLRYRHPYFFRQYDVFPAGWDRFDLGIRERESRTITHEAEVTVARERYVTKLNRKKKEAKSDAYFIRTVGTETIVYELRNGKWRRTGSVFLAGKEEEFIGGAWVARR